ncbi:MAG: hypothetical protein M3436_03445 [Pseudomonadota bacterium]|nr:hypothetical protein [Pseudomonadota bacterium]
MLIFGSFVSNTESPRDIDIVLFMQGDFKLEDVPRECQTLFSHADAEARFGASVFWLRDGMLSDEMAEGFLDTWQTKRDGAKRGIVEAPGDREDAGEDLGFPGHTGIFWWCSRIDKSRHGRTFQAPSVQAFPESLKVVDRYCAC